MDNGWSLERNYCLQAFLNFLCVWFWCVCARRLTVRAPTRAGVGRNRECEAYRQVAWVRRQQRVRREGHLRRLSPYILTSPRCSQDDAHKSVRTGATNNPPPLPPNTAHTQITHSRLSGSTWHLRRHYVRGGNSFRSSFSKCGIHAWPVTRDSCLVRLTFLLETMSCSF